MGGDYLSTKMQESLEVPSHGIPKARTGPQPDMMWRTNAVEEEQLTHCQQLTFIHGLLKQSINHKCKEHITDSRRSRKLTATSSEDKIKHYSNDCQFSS